MTSSGSLVFRVGRDLGVHVNDDGTVYGGVLLGALEHRLDTDRYRTWKACGTASLPAADVDVVRDFEDLGFVDDVAEHLEHLQDDGLVRSVEPDYLDSLLSFAATVRLCQVMPFQEVEQRASSTQQPLGVDGRILAAVGPALYPMLATAHRFAHLSGAIENAAAQERARGGSDVLLTAPQARLGDFVRTALGTLLEQNVAALEPTGEADA